MAKTLVINKDECTSCNLCVETVPGVFKLDDNQLAVVANQKGASEAEIQEAIDSCPAQCIKWE